MSRILFVLAACGVWWGGEAAVDAQEESAKPALASFAALKVAADDSPMTKLKKEKFNAALEALRLVDAKSRAGTGGFTRTSQGALEVTRSLRDAILDLDDKAVRMKAFDAYVDLTKIVETEARISFDAGSLDPYQYHLARYRYLDAQLLQLQLRKQAEKK